MTKRQPYRKRTVDVADNWQKKSWAANKRGEGTRCNQVHESLGSTDEFNNAIACPPDSQKI